MCASCRGAGIASRYRAEARSFCRPFSANGVLRGVISTRARCEAQHFWSPELVLAGSYILVARRYSEENVAKAGAAGQGPDRKSPNKEMPRMEAV